MLEIYFWDKLAKRFLRMDKISTAIGTSDDFAHSHRYGYGYLDENQNFQVDEGEKKVCFEFSDYSTPCVFFENPR